MHYNHLGNVNWPLSTVENFRLWPFKVKLHQKCKLIFISETMRQNNSFWKYRWPLKVTWPQNVNWPLSRKTSEMERNGANFRHFWLTASKIATFEKSTWPQKRKVAIILETVWFCAETWFRRHGRMVLQPCHIKYHESIKF